MKIIEIILTTIISSGIVSGIIAYIGKTFLGQFLSKELERYRSVLQSQIELFKSELNKEYHTFSTQFSQVYQRRVAGILEIHDIMCEIEQSVIWKSGGIDTALINTNPEDLATNELNKAWEDIAKLSRSLDYNLLFLDEKIYQFIHDWSKIMMALVSKTGNEIEAIRQSGVNANRPLSERLDFVNKIRNKYTNLYIPQLGPIRKELDSEFKKILGI